MWLTSTGTRLVERRSFPRPMLNLKCKAAQALTGCRAEGGKTQGDWESEALEDLPVILVIEDDPPIQVVVEDALTDGGFEPAIAPSGEEAVTLLKGRKGK